MKTTTLPIRNSMSRSPFRRVSLLIPFVLACFALSQTAQAVTPAPDGGYPAANTAEGDSALLSLTTGANNTAIGFNALMSNTIGNDNTATGRDALFSNKKGEDNTATGLQALYSNTIGSDNTATGYGALSSNTDGSDNTANGDSALYSNTDGDENTAIGGYSLFSNTTGTGNTATGFESLVDNNGDNNTADGFQALLNNTGSRNTANGAFALFSNTTGGSNTANGFDALFSNTGSNNIGLGNNAGVNLTTGDNNIDIGNAGVAGDASKIRIGKVGTQKNTFIAGISGVTVAGGVGVIIDTNGHLGTIASSERFKDAIKPMDKASEAILALKPVTFRYKHELDPDGIPQFGLVAEQVEKMNPDLVARDADGKVYTVRYEAVNAMLLNEFLKEHSTVQELKKEIAALTATVKEQAAQIQKVSAQIEVTKSAPQVVNNNQ